MTQWLRPLATIGGLAALLSLLVRSSRHFPVPTSAELRFADPAMVATGLLRLLAIGLTAYLLATMVIAVVARLSGSVRLIHLSVLITPEVLRRVAGVALSASLATSATPAHADDDIPILRRPMATTTVPELSTSAAPAAAVTASTALLYTVRPGDSFWSIAERHCAPTSAAADLHRYWTTLVDLNRNRLIDPGNPDLISPGQELELPEN